MHQQEEETKSQPFKVTRVPGWLLASTFAFIVVIVIVVLYIQFTRYKLVGASLLKGDTVTSALLLSPEIATGLSAILSATSP